MASFKITGEIKKVSTSKVKEWDKINFVLETEEEYNNLYYFELFGDKATEFGELMITNTIVSVDFNIKTNEFNDKYYTNLTAWKVSIAEGDENPQVEQSKSEVKEVDGTAEDDDDNDLPF